MSDPASRSESDAVLASIRRILVTTREDRDAPGETPAQGPLILTEDLRVDTERDAPTNGLHADVAKREDEDGAGRDTPRDLPDAPADTALENTVVDEEFLRDIVSEIVRQELQGELGERITRNVRKLVRREIHRAMASRDFD